MTKSTIETSNVSKLVAAYIFLGNKTNPKEFLEVLEKIGKKGV